MLHHIVLRKVPFFAYLLIDNGKKIFKFQAKVRNRKVRMHPASKKLTFLLVIVQIGLGQMPCDKNYCPHCYPSFSTNPPSPICLFSPAPVKIENCMQASLENAEFCGRCKPGFMLAEGNTKCVETKIENCISGIVVGRN